MQEIPSNKWKAEEPPPSDNPPKENEGCTVRLQASSRSIFRVQFSSVHPILTEGTLFPHASSSNPTRRFLSESRQRTLSSPAQAFLLSYTLTAWPHLFTCRFAVEPPRHRSHSDWELQEHVPHVVARRVNFRRSFTHE